MPKISGNPAIDSALRSREIRVERIINYARAIIFGAGMVLDVITAVRTGIAGKDYAFFVSALSALILGYLVTIHLLTTPSRYRPWVKYLTVTVDIAITASYFIEVMRPAIHNVMSTDAAIALYVIITILIVLESSLRLDRVTIIYGTTLAAAGVIVVNRVAMTDLVLRVWSAPLVIVVGAITFWVSGNIRRTVFELIRRERLARFLPREVVGLVESEDDEAALGGKRCDVTVMFADIRGFTHYSENRPPEEVVAVLNEYLTVMSRVILDHGGMIDKFVGDEIMAVFGAPVMRPDDVLRAVACAREMQKSLALLNEKWRTENRDALEIGIALHYGEVVAGNVGSPERVDYTVIGDTVNVASRVESLNKTFGTSLLLTDAVRTAAELTVGLRFVGDTPIRGRERPIAVYAYE